LQKSSSEEDEASDLPQNGRLRAAKASANGRSTSASHLEGYSTDHKPSNSVNDRSAALLGHQPQQRSISPIGFHSHSNSMSHQTGSAAKESFLNYFFGGSAAGSTLPVASSSMGSRRTHLQDMQRSDNPLVGRKGLEGSAAAFDMKSLDKHMLEPVRQHQMHSVCC
jgi:dynamin 1-like protein